MADIRSMFSAIRKRQHEASASGQPKKTCVNVAEEDAAPGPSSEGEITSPDVEDVESNDDEDDLSDEEPIRQEQEGTVNTMVLWLVLYPSEKAFSVCRALQTYCDPMGCDSMGSNDVHGDHKTCVPCAGSSGLPAVGSLFHSIQMSFGNSHKLCKLAVPRGAGNTFQTCPRFYYGEHMFKVNWAMCWSMRALMLKVFSGSVCGGLCPGDIIIAITRFLKFNLRM